MHHVPKSEEVRPRSVPVLGTDSPIADAALVLQQAKSPALPVVDSDETFVGEFGEQELIASLLPQHMTEFSTSWRMVPDRLLRWIAARRQPAARTVGECARRSDLLVVERPCTCAALATAFGKDRGLAVAHVVENGRVVGIVTRSDVAGSLMRLATSSAGS